MAFSLCALRHEVVKLRELTVPSMKHQRTESAGETNMRITIAGLLIGALAMIGVAQQTKTAHSPIGEDALRAHIKFLSDDLLEGRGTGARGGETAAKYIAAQLEALGLKAARPNGSFFQPVSLVGVKADPNTKLTISSNKD